jgi:hypothetical protein
MNKSPYEVIKSFSLRTDLRTQVVVEVSAHGSNGRRSFRVAAFREWEDRTGKRRSPWLGALEMQLKAGLEKSAMEFIAEEKAKQKAAAVAIAVAA